jgi:hypothetical protein
MARPCYCCPQMDRAHLAVSGRWWDAVPVAAPATTTSYTGWFIVLGLVVVVAACILSYYRGYRKGESKAIRDFDRMEGRSTKQKLDDFRQGQKRSTYRNRNRSKAPSSESRNGSKKSP